MCAATFERLIFSKVEVRQGQQGASRGGPERGCGADEIASACGEIAHNTTTAAEKTGSGAEMRHRRERCVRGISDALPILETVGKQHKRSDVCLLYTSRCV